jgi:uncharacterized protein
MSNIDTIKELYKAFGEGRIDTILSRLADDVVWEYPETSTSVPWLQSRYGREAAAGFFESLSEMELRKFDPHTFLEGPDVVVALIDVEFVVKKTGARVEETDEIHVWRFGPNGLISKFKHGVDSHRHQLAISSVAAAS